MPEQLTDEQILGIEDDAPAPSSEVGESPEPTSPEDSSPSESTEQSTSEPTQQETPESSEAKTPDKASEKPQPETAEKPQPEAETLEEQFPGGRDQAAEVIGKANELDGIDTALHSGEVSDIAQVVMNAGERSGEKFPDVLHVGLNWLEQQAPQQHAKFVSGLVGRELQDKGVWPALEQIYEATPPGPARDSLNHLASVFGAYGLGPSNPAAEKAAWDDFRGNADTDVTDTLNRQIERRTPGYASAPADLRDNFQRDVHELIHKWVPNDPKFVANVQNAAQDALRGSRLAQIELADLLRAKALSLLPEAQNQVLAQPKYAPLKVAAKPAQIASNGAENWLTQDEANRMEPLAILSEKRTGQKRAPRTPASVFDELTGGA